MHVDFTVAEMRSIATSLPMPSSAKAALLAGAEALMRAEILLRRIEETGGAEPQPSVVVAVTAFNAERRSLAR